MVSIIPFYMKYLWCCLVLMLAVHTVWSQDLINFDGIVVDSSGVALELAHVVALDQDEESVVSYGVTDYEGGFTLKLTQGNQYLLRVSFIGYESSEQQIEAQPGTSLQVVLIPSLEQLQAMEMAFLIMSIHRT